MLDEAIELLTKQMIENDFKDKSSESHKIVKLTKTQLYQFCIRLVKIIREVETQYR